MDKDTLTSVEFDKILERCEHLAFTNGGKSLIRTLTPYIQIEEAKEGIKETTDAKKFLQGEGDLPFVEFIDIEPLFEHIKVLSLLTPQEMLRVANVLSTISEIKEIGTSFRDEYPLIFKYTTRLSSFDDIVKDIRSVIANDGKIVDDATPLLGIIRREMKTTYLRIQSILQEILYSKENEDVIQDRIITKRNNRYVIPIRLNSKPSFSYVVQGESGSRLTLFIEPTAVVELNNKLVELFLKEQKEEERIILGLEERIRNRMEHVEHSLDIIYHLDFIFAKARLSIEEKANEVEIVDEPMISLYEARNPFIPEERVVPIDIEAGKGFKMLIITGPNTGGKTVTLKTVGLLTLMAKSGMHIPAISNSKIGFFREVFADIGDEQSIEQSLSTFSSHMVRIINIIKSVNASDLVLIDELGAGTDPEEGAALGYAILKKLYEIGATSIITTHHSKLKEFPYKFDKAVNASVGFDIDTLSPTYKLYTGLPGESHALIIAERLGLPKDALDYARGELTTDYKEKSLILSKMHEDRKSIESMRNEIEMEKVETAKLKEVYEQKLKELEERRQSILRKAYEESQRLIDETKEKMNKILENLDNFIKSQKEIQDMKKVIKEEERALEGREEEFVPQKIEGELSIGALVYVPSFQMQGVVLQIKKDINKVIVQMGAIRATLNLNEVKLIEEEENKEEKKEKDSNIKSLLTEEVPIRVDLHGYTVEESIDFLDRYLDKAYLHGFPYVYIIHGKGSGTLKEAIYEYLKKDKRVARIETGLPGEGGSGITIVYFK